MDWVQPGDSQTVHQQRPSRGFDFPSSVSGQLTLRVLLLIMVPWG
jgi:hypothetical protein